MCVFAFFVLCQLAYLAGTQLLALYITMCLPMQAEVQSFYADGAIALHTRSLKYGKVSKTTYPKASTLVMPLGPSFVQVLP